MCNELDMENKIYYIQGSKENPEGVKQALLEVYPNAENIDDFNFNIESSFYYGINGHIDNALELDHIALVKQVGIELQPKNPRRVFVEKTMYQRIFKDEYKEIYGSMMYYSTIEDAMAGEHAIGYKEVKVMIKE